MGRKRHRQAPTGFPELDESENQLFQKIEQDALDRRHSWKVWLLGIGMLVIAAILILNVHPLVGVAALFFMVYLGKDYNPIPKDQRFDDD